MSDSPTGEELVVSGIQDRITEMLNHADDFIFLPGDFATLEALITLASWVHLHIHQKPISLLNVNNFYDGFIAFLNHVIKNYFIPSTAKKLLFVLTLLMSYFICYKLIDRSQTPGPFCWSVQIMMVTVATVRSTN